ncbi:hypothetical protein HPB47_023569, partial [Ixodes persulcatus]
MLIVTNPTSRLGLMTVEHATRCHRKHLASAEHTDGRHYGDPACAMGAYSQLKLVLWKNVALRLRQPGSTEDVFKSAVDLASTLSTATTGSKSLRLLESILGLNESSTLFYTRPAELQLSKEGSILVRHVALDVPSLEAIVSDLLGFIPDFIRIGLNVLQTDLGPLVEKLEQNRVRKYYVPCQVGTFADLLSVENTDVLRNLERRICQKIPLLMTQFFLEPHVAAISKMVQDVNHGIEVSFNWVGAGSHTVALLKSVERIKGFRGSVFPDVPALHDGKLKEALEDARATIGIDNTPQSYGCLYVSRLEEQGLGAQWETLWESPIPGDSMNFGYCIGLLLFDSIIYLLVAFVVSSVFQNDITDLQGILKVIRGVVPLAQVANDHGGGEVVISLPQRDPTENTVYPFSELISVLDERMLEFGFGTYGFSSTTLEEVFLSLCAVCDTEYGSKAAAQSLQSLSQAAMIRLHDKVDRTHSKDTPVIGGERSLSGGHGLSGSALKKSQFKALLLKRLYHTVNNWKAIFFSIVLPCIFIALAMGFTLIVPVPEPEPSLRLTTQLYGPGAAAFISVSHVAEVGIAIVILMGLSFIPSRVVVYVVNERVRDEKQVQRISGIGPLLYWTTTFIWDMGLVLAAVILSCLIIVAFGLPVYVSKLNFPAVALLMVLFGLTKNQIQADVYQRFGQDTYESPFSERILAYNYCAMFLVGVICFCVNLVFEYHFIRGQTSQPVICNIKPLASKFCVLMLLRVNLNRMQVYHQGYKAVNNVSFGIPKGECFGLLGVNGAGKTTLFRILTGQLQPTKGGAFIQDKSLAKVFSKGTQLVGYCPQADALDDLLSPRQHLVIYAMMRGISDCFLFGFCQVVEEALARFQLTMYSNHRVGTLSRGTRRKVCTAISMLGDPQLCPPGFGMDPVTRRLVWANVSEAVRDKRSVLLTSH